MSSESLASAQLSEGIANLRMLPAEKQQKVLDFIEFLKAKVNQQGVARTNWQPGISALEAAGDSVGCLIPRLPNVIAIRKTLSRDSRIPGQTRLMAHNTLDAEYRHYSASTY